MFGKDDIVSLWANEKFGHDTSRYMLAIGVMDDDEMVGAAFYHAWNGYDVEFSYFGPNTLNLGLARTFAKIAIECFGVTRVSAKTARDNKEVTRKIKKLGFKYEGIKKFGYGDTDAIMYGLYGKDLSRLANIKVH
jgi:RimJ/RimL family protein N-acetyltransferase